jgi:hypothetical protein
MLMDDHGRLFHFLMSWGDLEFVSSLSEVEVRPLVLSHSFTAGEYLTDLPILTKGGPSPRIRDLASQLTDTLSRRATSAGVSSLGMSVPSPPRAELVRAGVEGASEN